MSYEIRYFLEINLEFSPGQHCCGIVSTPGTTDPEVAESWKAFLAEQYPETPLAAARVSSREMWNDGFEPPERTEALESGPLGIQADIPTH